MRRERLTNIEIGNERSLVPGKVLATRIRNDAVIDPAHCHTNTPRLNLVGRMHRAGWHARTDGRTGERA